MPEIASAITEEINAIEDYSTIPTLTDENKDLVVLLGEEQDTAFIEAVKTQLIRKELVKNVGKEFKIVYTFEKPAPVSTTTPSTPSEDITTSSISMPSPVPLSMVNE